MMGLASLFSHLVKPDRLTSPIYQIEWVWTDHIELRSGDCGAFVDYPEYATFFMHSTSIPVYRDRTRSTVMVGTGAYCASPGPHRVESPDLNGGRSLIAAGRVESVVRPVSQDCPCTGLATPGSSTASSPSLCSEAVFYQHFRPANTHVQQTVQQPCEQDYESDRVGSRRAVGPEERSDRTTRQRHSTRTRNGAATESPSERLSQHRETSLGSGIKRRAVRVLAGLDRHVGSIREARRRAHLSVDSTGGAIGVSTLTSAVCFAGVVSPTHQPA